MSRSGTTWLIAGLISAVCAVATTTADTWMPPGETSYDSRGREFRLRVFPRVISSVGDYFRQSDQGAGKRGQKAGERDTCVGQLEKVRDDGSYVAVWRRDLLNDVSPVRALVTADGRYVVTFDNWHSMGYGKDVVVIYGPEGRLVTSLGLAGFLSKEQIARLPRSISSIQWGGAHHFDQAERHVVLLVAAARDESASGADGWQTVVIALEDGRVQGDAAAPGGPRNAGEQKEDR